MKAPQHAFTRVALLVVIALIAILATLWLTARDSARRKAQNMACIDNLKMCCTAFKVWSGDQTSDFPLAVSEARGGSRECVTGPETYRHFQVASNELSTPKILVCPADPERTIATDFGHLSNRNVSYFVDLNAVDDADPELFLFGDRNIIGENPPENGVLKLVPGQSQSVSWTSAIHVNKGNISLADGSVQTMTSSNLHKFIKDYPGPTNIWRISLPE